MITLTTSSMSLLMFGKLLFDSSKNILTMVAKGLKKVLVKLLGIEYFKKFIVWL